MVNTKKDERINIYDAIQKIYGLNLARLAEILDVTLAVMVRAKNQGTPAKRVAHFSAKLCIPVEFFASMTTKRLVELEKCKNDFFEHGVPTSNSKNLEWKNKMLATLIDITGCTEEDAFKIFCLPNFNWNIKTPIEQLNENEQALIKSMQASRGGNGFQLTSVEYKIDVFCGGVNLGFSIGKIK